MDFDKETLSAMSTFSPASVQKLALLIASEIAALDNEAMERPLEGLINRLRDIR